jgi:hypothetical protein
MEITLPENIIKILNDESLDDETILFKNKYFVLLIDPKNTDDSFHFTAWYRDNIPSLTYINFDIYQQILDLKNILIEKKIIQKDSISYIHYPPHFYRLHIHFVDKNHKYHAPKHQIFHLNEIKNLFMCKL